MRWHFLILLFSTSFCSNSYAEPLNENRLKLFSKQLEEVVRISPKNIYEYLSEKLEVESSYGTNNQGLTLYYNKPEFIKSVNKNIEITKKANESSVTKMFDYLISSPSTGSFSTRTDIEAIKLTIWTTYYVEVEDNKIFIVKIIEST